MPNVAIKRTIERVPGGMMSVPLFTGATIATIWPGVPLPPGDVIERAAPASARR